MTGCGLRRAPERPFPERDLVLAACGCGVALIRPSVSSASVSSSSPPPRLGLTALALPGPSPPLRLRATRERLVTGEPMLTALLKLLPRRGEAAARLDAALSPERRGRAGEPTAAAAAAATARITVVLSDPFEVPSARRVFLATATAALYAAVAAASDPAGAVMLRQSTHLQLSLHATPAWKHSQYFFRQ